VIITSDCHITDSVNITFLSELGAVRHDLQAPFSKSSPADSKAGHMILLNLMRGCNASQMNMPKVHI
jgi:hypothetical protein